MSNRVLMNIPVCLCHVMDVVQQVDNEATPEKVVVDMAARTRKPTRKYIAKRRNGHYTSPAVAVKATKTCSSEVPLHKVKRKLHFGRKPPIQREKAINLERSKLPTKKQTFGKATVKNKRKRISKELLDLLDMADHFIYSEKLRSKNLKRPCHGDHGMSHGAYKLHSSHEVTNLIPGRQN